MFVVVWAVEIATSKLHVPYFQSSDVCFHNGKREPIPKCLTYAEGQHCQPTYTFPLCDIEGHYHKFKVESRPLGAYWKTIKMCFFVWKFEWIFDFFS